MDVTRRDTKPKDRPFDPAKVPASEAMRQLVVEVIARIAAAETRVRRRQAQVQAIHEAAATALVCDLVHRALSEPEGWLTVELSKGELSPAARRAPFLTEQFRDLVKALASPEVAVVDLQVGHKSASESVRSTARASKWLRQRIDELALLFGDIGRSPVLQPDPLLLRSTKVAGEAQELPIPDCERARQLRAEMDEINGWLAKADLAWEGCEVTDRVDLGQRYLRRVFNDGSLARGGRLFYGFWQDLPKVERMQFLRIEGGPVASLDFAQMSVRLAYAQVRVTPPAGDLYQIPGVGGSREGIKKVMNALLASDKILGKLPQGTRPYFPARVKMADVVAAISARHPSLVPLFGTAQALSHQNIESRIIVRALLQLKDMGVVALPVHDCLLIKDSERSAAQFALEAAFEEVTGLIGKVEVERSPVSLKVTTVHLGSPIEGGVSA